MLKQLIISATLLALPGKAQACMFFQPFKINHADAAETVFFGTVSSYETRADNSAATITFRPLEFYRGNAAAEVTALWHNSTFGLPETMDDFVQDYGTKLVVGIYKPAPSPKAKHNQPLQSSNLIVQAHCHGPFMLKEDKREEIRKYMQYANGLRAIKNLFQ